MVSENFNAEDLERSANMNLGAVSERRAPAAYPPTFSSSQNQASTSTRARPVFAQQQPLSLNQGSEVERRTRAGTKAVSADQNRAATFEQKQALSQTLAVANELRLRALMGNMGRDRAASAARGQAPAATSWNPPILTAGANAAVATSSEHENRARVLQAEQRRRAEMNAALLLEQRRAARIATARANMQRNPEVERRIRAQWEADERDRAALATRGQARAAPWGPPVVTENANRAAAALAARDQANAGFRDSLYPSPLTTSQTAPLSLNSNSSPGAPTNTTTTSEYPSTTGQTRPRAPWSIAQLLQIHHQDPEYRELTKQEKYDRKCAMHREVNARQQEKRKRRRAQDSQSEAG